MSWIVRSTSILLFVAILSGCGTPKADRPPAPNEIEALERQMWDDWKNARYSAMGERMLPHAVMLGQEGITDRAGVVAAMERGACQIDSYSLEDVRVTVLAPTVALISYRSGAVGTCGGQPISGSPSEVNSSIWIKRDGTWMAAAHHQNPISQ